MIESSAIPPENSLDSFERVPEKIDYKQLTHEIFDRQNWEQRDNEEYIEFKKVEESINTGLGKIFPSSALIDKYGVGKRIETLPEECRGDAMRVWSMYMKCQFAGNKQRGEDLYNIASLLRGSVLNLETALTEIRESLRNKKVLVIGDDVGTLSEILNKLGATAYGVEYDENAVAVAHSGIVAEDFSPQLQVIQGDAWDLADDKSKLFDTISRLGPFDLVYSMAVLNGGSGFPEALRERAREQTRTLPEGKKGRQYDTAVVKGIYEFYLGVDRLLSENGVQLHTHLADRGKISYYKYADPDLMRKINESVVDENVSQIAIPARLIRDI